MTGERDRRQRLALISQDETAVVREFDPLARAISRDYFLPAADHDDVLQHARIGLLLAWRSYDSQTTHSPARFAGYASLVIHRKLASEVRTALRGKRGAGTQPLSLAAPAYHSDTVLEDLLAAPDVWEQREALAQVIELAEHAKRLTPTEREGLRATLMGAGPDGWTKRLDNASRRAKTKLRQHLKDAA